MTVTTNSLKTGADSRNVVYVKFIINSVVWINTAIICFQANTSCILFKLKKYSFAYCSRYYFFLLPSTKI
jgi:hypothetical protein